MVCDFCARALEKVFSEKQEVAAIDVDLDNGKISINFNEGASLNDSLIQKLVTNSGYDVVKIKGVDVDKKEYPANFKFVYFAINAFMLRSSSITCNYWCRSCSCINCACDTMVGLFIKI